MCVFLQICFICFYIMLFSTKNNKLDIISYLYCFYVFDIKLYQGTISQLPIGRGEFDLVGGISHPKNCQRFGNSTPIFFTLGNFHQSKVQIFRFLITFIDIFRIFFISYGCIIHKKIPP